MPLELIPFVCGACWYLGWRPVRGGLLAGSLLIGTAVAAVARELALPPPYPLLAVLTDSTAAAVGGLMARVAVAHTRRPGTRVR